MTITTLPTASAIRIESRLRPEQVNVNYANAAALEADVTARIVKYQAVIEKKLASVDNSDANQLIAAEALQLRVLASLFGTAGYLDSQYWDRAQELKAESADLLDDLVGTSADVPANISGTMTPTRRDGYSGTGTEYTCGDEYWRCSRC